MTTSIMPTGPLSHRPATFDDLAEVVAFPQNVAELFFCYPKAVWPLDVEQLAAAMEARSDSTVALLEGRVAGFANFYQWQQGKACALGNLMIAPWARGQGVARYLVTTMEQLARERHQATRMHASCFNANSAGLLLYPALSYALRGLVERRDPQGNRVALLQFDKAL
ncbi:N-acetyltransferase family protein [Pseudomonas borbori]